jgi:hypothetical protein
MEDRRRIPRVMAALSCIAIGAFYLWCAQTVNEPFEWRHDKGGYYNWLGRALAAGHLYLPVEPSKELLALPDPWDPVRNEPYRVQDLALFNRRYYLYHGVTPACLLFAPWRLLTGRDVPEAFGAFLFCYLGYLCSVAALLRWLAYAKARPSAVTFALSLGALGICNGAPFLLLRVSVYEVAIAAGYLCLSAGFYFLSRALLAPEPSRGSLVLAGLFLGMATGCRPHFGLAAPLAGLAILRVLGPGRWREILRYALPAAACGLALAAYNYARFHNPFEFGMHYEMASPAYFRPTPARANLLPGLYYLLASPPVLDPVFPYIRLAWRLPFNLPNYALPERYFLEMIAGACAIFPLTLAIPLYWRRLPDRRSRALAGALLLTAAGSVLFIASLGLVSHRYQSDFTPSLVLLACMLLCSVATRAAMRICLLAALACGIVANLAIGITGPYDELVQVRPVAYVNLARCFSPVARYRPRLDTRLEVDADFEFPGEGPLITAGRFGSRYLLQAEKLAEGKVRLISSGAVTGGNRVAVELPTQPGRNHVHLRYEPARHEMTIDWNGQPAIRQSLPFLVTAPAQVRIGEDRAEIDPRPAKFTGRAWPGAIRF